MVPPHEPCPWKVGTGSTRSAMTTTGDRWADDVAFDRLRRAEAVPTITTGFMASMHAPLRIGTSHEPV